MPPVLTDCRIALARLAGHSRRALELLRHRLALDPNHAPSRIRCAEILLQSGDCQAALAEADRAVAAAPNNVRARCERASIFSRTDRPAEAEADLLEAARLAPKSHEVWFLLGEVRLQRGDAAGARQAFQKTVSLEPFHAEAWCRLACAHASLGEHEAVRRVVAQLARIDPRIALRVETDLLRACPHRNPTGA